LNLCNSEQITDNGLQHLTKLTKLQQLDLSDCYKISDNGVQYLIKLTSLQ